jgi:GNAT superfamily N-acetyltransferase
MFCADFFIFRRAGDGVSFVCFYQAGTIISHKFHKEIEFSTAFSVFSVFSVVQLVFNDIERRDSMIEVFEQRHLAALRDLINIHLSTVTPGWAMPERYIERHLHVNPHQPMIDPWVVERKTLVALHRNRVMGAAHLLRYGTEDPVGGNYVGAVDIAWFLFWGREDTPAVALLDACHTQMDEWNARSRFAFDSHLPISIYGGIPDCWQHISALFDSAGYQAAHGGAVFGGTLDAIGAPGDAPVPGMTMRRVVRGQRDGVSFAAELNGEFIGWSEWVIDLTAGGDLPALRGWAELTEMFVKEEWRNRGIGAWLIKHAAVWLRLAHIDRVTLHVDRDDDAEGAGRFYERQGWFPFARFRDGWKLK